LGGWAERANRRHRARRAKTVDDGKGRGAAGRDTSFGHGLVQAKAAVELLKARGQNVFCR
jgi:hypothetical protein